MWLSAKRLQDRTSCWSADRPNAGFWPKNVLDIHKGPVPEESKKGFGGGGLPAHPDTLNLLGRDFESGQMARDMNLFVDDDGKAYHIYASEDNSTLHISELTDDYTACSGNYAVSLSAVSWKRLPCSRKTASIT